MIGRAASFGVKRNFTKASSTGKPLTEGAISLILRGLIRMLSLELVTCILFPLSERARLLCHLAVPSKCPRRGKFSYPVSNHRFSHKDGEVSPSIMNAQSHANHLRRNN